MITILIVDDQKFAIRAIASILETLADLEIIGTANNGAKALKIVEQVQPDIAIVDLEMPEMDGFKLTQEICQNFPQTKVIIFSSHHNQESIKTAVQAGARGYLLKSELLTTNFIQETFDTIRYVNRGYFQLGPGLFEQLIYELINDQINTETGDTKLKTELKHYFSELEEELTLKHQSIQLDLCEQIDSQIVQIKSDFQDGLAVFQQQVAKQLDSGFQNFIKSYEFNQLDAEDINNWIKEHSFEYKSSMHNINRLFFINKQTVEKMKRQISFLRYCLIILGILWLAESLIITLK